MEEKIRSKIEFKAQQLSRLKNIAHSQQMIIENLAKVQLEMDEANEDLFFGKVGEIFSSVSKNQDLLHGMVHDYEIELNKLRNE